MNGGLPAFPLQRRAVAEIKTMSNDKKVAIVTGGLSGIGEAVAQRLAADGVRVIAADIAAKTDKLDPAAVIAPFHLDVADAASVTVLIREVERVHGGLDYLVHSAGVGKVSAFLETAVEDFDRIVAVNLRGTFLIGKAAAELMRKTGGGVIVNIGSVSGLRGSVGRAAYGATKGAVVTLSEVMAVELAQYGIRVNVVAPGPIETAMSAKNHSAAVRASWMRVLPMQRYGTPQDIAGAVAFLCSDDACYVTGHVLAVDGGYAGGGIIQVGEA
jgi:NAD(P)-dependent dehydrogenase (short-subunit alcohol dehydrogenase family)